MTASSVEEHYAAMLDDPEMADSALAALSKLFENDTNMVDVDLTTAGASGSSSNDSNNGSGTRSSSSSASSSSGKGCSIHLCPVRSLHGYQCRQHQRQA